MNHNLNLLLAGLFAAGVAGCKQYSGATASISPSPLEVRGDSVVFIADINLPADKYQKGLTYVAQPELGEFKFNEGRINLDEYPDANVNGVQTELTFSAPYQGSEMNSEMLDIEQQFIKANGKVKDAKDIDDLAACCVQTPGLFVVNGEFMSTDLPDRVIEPQKLVSQFNFPQDVFLLERDQISDEDVAMIKSYLEDPKSAEKIEIHGYASPEGPWKRNEMLATRRAEVVRDLLEEKLIAAGFEGNLEDRVEIKINQTTEDWDGFSALVAKNAPADQEEILVIAGGSESADSKEEALTELTDGNIMNLEANLAPLRRTTVIVPCKVRCVSPEEIDSVAVAFISGQVAVEDLKSVYTQEQWLEAAQSTDAPAGKKSLLVAYYDTYPTDYRVYNELGVAALTSSLDIKVEDDEYKIETDDFELSVEDDEWKLELADGSEVKMEDDELKISDEASKSKFEDDEYKIETENSELKVENDEIKLEEGDLKVKIEDDQKKLEQDNMKIKVSPLEEQIKIKDDNFVLKVDGNEMKVREDGMTYHFEDYLSNSVAMDYLDRYSIAMEHFTRAEELYNKDHVVMSNIGAVHITRQNLEDAESYLTHSLTLKETNHAHYNLGVVYALRGDYEDALLHFEAAGDNPKYLYNRGLAKLLSGDYEGASADIATFIGANPDYASAYYVMAIVDARTGNAEGVNANLKKSWSLDPELEARAMDDFEFRDYNIAQHSVISETE